MSCLRVRLSVNGRSCATYVFPLILYRLSVLSLCKNRKKALEGLLFFLLCGDCKHQVCRKIVAYRPCIGGWCWEFHTMNHRHASRLAFLCRALTEDSILEAGVRNAFLILTITLPVSRADRRRKPRNQSRFLRECRLDLTVIP